MTKDYLFFRHAEAKNQDPSFSEEMVRDAAGRTDYPLSGRGREQAARAAKRARSFGAELVISSDLRRARETAEIIAREAGLSAPGVDPDLAEVNPGSSSLGSLSFASRSLATVSLTLVAGYLFDRRVAARRDGESAIDLLSRIERAFDRLAKLEASRVAVVGHGYWIFTAAMLVTPSIVARLARARTVGHCSATRILREESGALRVIALGRPT